MTLSPVLFILLGMGSPAASSPTWYATRLCCDMLLLLLFAQSLGTVTHLAPELLANGRQTPACDVYSFGMMSE